MIPITDEGELRIDLLDGLLTDRTKIVAVVHVSNSLGTVNPIATIVEKAHARGIPVLVDGAQAVAHMPVDVQALGCDFYAMSGHKLFGPTGIGVLWGRLPLLEEMPPYQGGGDMISAVSFKKTTYNVVPNKFEAGTPNIAGSVGLGAAIDYLGGIDYPAMQAYEDELLAYGTRALTSVPGIRMVGTASKKASILSFVMEDVHPHDIGTILDREGVAIGPAIIARSRSWSGCACRLPRGHRWRYTIRKRKSTLSSARWPESARFSLEGCGASGSRDYTWTLEISTRK